ncbi:hypothetical protein G6F46_015138 [Rhizopus delemar]|nr:hypothetical protein G6F46_015138 [Rhizopus delemar]
MLELAWASLRSRALSVGLTVLVITLRVVLLLGVERVRTQAHEGFASTVSGTDLIVGALLPGAVGAAAGEVGGAVVTG